MTYKVIEKVNVADGFKSYNEASLWADRNLNEDEDRTWEIKKE